MFDILKGVDCAHVPCYLVAQALGLYERAAAVLQSVFENATRLCHSSEVHRIIMNTCMLLHVYVYRIYGIPPLLPRLSACQYRES